MGLRGLVKDAAEATAKRLVKAPEIEANLMLLRNIGKGRLRWQNDNSSKARSAVYGLPCSPSGLRYTYTQPM